MCRLLASSCRRISFWLLVWGLSGLLVLPCFAQGAVAVELTGGVQPRAEAGAQEGEAPGPRLGLGIRRVRLQAVVLYDDRIGMELDVDASTGTVKPLDLVGFYNLTPRLRVRVGQIVGAQARSYAVTSFKEIDAVDRAALSLLWADGTIGLSGRDIGADVRYRSDLTEAVLFVHSGAGAFARETGNFRESIISPSVTREVDPLGPAVTGMVAQRLPTLPSLEVGAFAGVNPVGSERTTRGDVRRGYSTGGAHLYWGARPGSEPVRLKLDVLGLRYGSDERGVQQWAGVSGFGAVRVLRHGEVFGRHERIWNDDGDATRQASYTTVGGSYSPSAARGERYRSVRLTLAYANRRDEVLDDAHLLVLQGQFAF